MFGQGGSNFGSQGNTFGQSAFGAAKPSTFGTPTFGTSAPSGTSSLFGAAPQQPTTNLFGSTATPFGQAQNTGFGTTTPSTGFGFGTGTSAPATGTSMFGGTPSIFGTTQQQQQTPASTGSIFGTQTSFGNKPAFGSFGTSSGSIFGQTSQPSTTSSIFGQQQASTATGGLFGTGTSTFGGGLGATPGQVGTGAVKFKAIQGTDTVSKNNTTQTVQVRHQVITCQPEYEAKSFEELRFEDYQANRKGPGQGGAMFGTTATPGLFGASTTTQPSTGGLFGQQQRSIFGSTQTATPALGSSTGIFGQQPQQQQQTSLFGAKTFGVPTTTASGFSFPSAATSSAGGGLFGAKPFGTPAPSTGVFSGAPTTSAPSFGSTTGGFGSQTTSPFGAKPSIFGATTTTSSFFSSPATSTGSLFGQQKSPFGAPSAPFGAATTTTSSLFAPTTSTTPFGSTQTGFGFGQTQSPFGAKPPTGVFGTGTNFATNPSPFGAQVAAPSTTPFGSTTTNIFGLNQPTASGFGQPPPTQTPVPQVAPPSSLLATQLMAISQSTYSDNPVLRNIIEGPVKREELLKPSVQQLTPSTKTTVPSYYKVSPRIGTTAKPMALTSNVKVGLFEGLEEDERKPADDLLFKPRQSVKKLTLKPKGGNRVILDLNGIQSPPVDRMNGEVMSVSRDIVQRRPPVLDDTVAEIIKRPQSRAKDQTMASDVAEVSLDGTNNETHVESYVEPEVQDLPPHPLGINCRRYGYYTIPSLEELSRTELDPDGAVVVENFVVGRDGYGNILFKGPMNVVGLDIDKYVFILHKQVNVYPNDDDKPSVGEEFNRKAQVTLDRVWPIDKATGLEIRDPKRLEERHYREKLQNCSEKSGARFKEYRPETGSWVFDVPHFSKYGIEEADEEDQENFQASPVLPPEKGILESQVVKHTHDRQPLSPLTVVADVEDEIDTRRSTRFSVDHDEAELCGVERDVSSPSYITGPRQLLALVGTPVQKTQLNKLSMFSDVDQETDFATIPSKKRKNLSPLEGIKTRQTFGIPLQQLEYEPASELKKTSFREILERSVNAQYRTDADLSGRSFLEARPVSRLSNKSLLPPEDFDEPLEVTRIEPGEVEPERFRKVVPKFAFQCPKDDNDTINQVSKVICDRSLNNGKRTRIGWNSKMKLAVPSIENRQAALRFGTSPFVVSINQIEVEDLNPSKPSKPIGHLHLLSNIKNFSKQEPATPQTGFYGQLLTAELENCLFVESEAGQIHRFIHPHGSSLLEKQFKVLQTFLRETKELGFVTGDVAYINYTKEVYALCSSLWGKLPEDVKAGSYAESMLRKKLLGEWISDYAALDSFPDGSSTVDFALAELTGHRVSNATERLTSINDYNSAFAVCQIDGYETQQLTGVQLELWNATGAIKYIDRSRLRLFCGAAGLSTYQNSKLMINTCDKFSWRQAFAQHFWYVTPLTGSIVDAVKEFDAGFEEGYAAKPLPTYAEDDNSDSIKDVCYRLLKLYCDRMSPLEPLLNPASSTADPIEHTLSYLLLQVLLSLGYSHFTEFSEATVITSFAAQLEALGLWTWAVFVVMHLKNDFQRDADVKSILARNVRVDTDPKMELEIKFLIEKLLVPKPWISAAASFHAQSRHLHFLQAKYLVDAHLDKEVHQLVSEKLGPDAVLGRKVNVTIELLEELSRPERCSRIYEWSSCGAIYLSYLRLVSSVDTLMRQESPSVKEAERLLPSITSLCAKINLLSETSSKHKLTKSIMAKKAIHCVRKLLQIRSGGNVSALEVLPLIDALPLPEDIAIEEIQNILRNYTLNSAESMKMQVQSNFGSE